MNVSTKYENLLKILILGNSSVGKTNFINRFTENSYDDKYNATISFDYKSRIISLPDKKIIKIQIWDTLGQEKFMSINQNLLLKVHGVILMYDITDILSFEQINNWMNMVKEINDNIPIILVANKCDLGNMRIIGENEGNNLAQKLNISYIEASAKENINVEEAFIKISEEIMAYVKTKSVNSENEVSTDNFTNNMRRTSLTYKSKKTKLCFNCC